MENRFFDRPVDRTRFCKWTDNAINHSFWDSWWPIEGGVEAEVADARHSIGGKLDALIQHRDTGELAILDFKTKRKPESSKKCYRKQLGGYCNLIDICHPKFAGLITKGYVFFIFPDRVETELYDMQDCIERYLAARDLFLSKQPKFDF